MVEPLGRVFAAVAPTAEARLALHDQLKDVTIPGKVSPPENWHVTVRFLGRVERVQLERFFHGLSRVEDVERFRIVVKGLGAFPNPRRATVVWAGVADGQDSLELINEIAEDAAIASGLEAEDRPFRPHLTLSRVRPPENVSAILNADVGVKWECDRVVVYESHPGPVYKPIETFTLGGR